MDGLACNTCKEEILMKTYCYFWPGAQSVNIFLLFFYILSKLPLHTTIKSIWY